MKNSLNRLIVIFILVFALTGCQQEKARVLKAIRTVKEYVETDFFGESKTVPVYQYACYISTYELDAAAKSAKRDLARAGKGPCYGRCHSDR